MASWSRFDVKKLPQKCPFCPALSKRTFDEIGLFQHAIATSKYNANPDLVRSHSVLLNTLKGRMSNLVAANDPLLPTSRHGSSSQQPNSAGPSMPKMEEKGLVLDQAAIAEVKLVFPWTGIMMNVNYEKITNHISKNNSEGGGDGRGIRSSDVWNMELKEHFSYLNPRGVQAVVSHGLAVIDFGQDLLGYFDAQDFERGFAQSKRGKHQFESMARRQNEWAAQDMLGWIADENDYNQASFLGEILRKRGTLRAKPRFREAWTEQHDVLLHDLRSQLQEKNMKLMRLGKEVYNLHTAVCQSENAKYSAEQQFHLRECQYKNELETIKEKWSKANNDEILRGKERVNSLQAELKDFQEKFKHLEENKAQNASDETLIRQLIQLVEDKESLQDIVETLVYKERELNDKFLSAMDAAREVLEIKGNTESFGIRKVGVLNNGPWKKACAQRYKEDWETPCTSLVSLWEDVNLRDTSWFPFKVVAVEGGKLEERIDTSDDRLATLRKDFGVEVYETVVDALNELREYNPSGRYPVSIPWNFELGRPAQLDEIIKYIGLVSVKKRKT